MCPEIYTDAAHDTQNVQFYTQHKLLASFVFGVVVCLYLLSKLSVHMEILRLFLKIMIMLYEVTTSLRLKQRAWEVESQLSIWVLFHSSCIH